MAGQGSYCCTTQRALCFWCATFLVLYGGGLLLFSVLACSLDLRADAPAGRGRRWMCRELLREPYVSLRPHGPMFLFAAAVVGFGGC